MRSIAATTARLGAAPESMLLPLCLIEGMAECLSVGGNDPHTAGGRYRLQASPVFGGLNFGALLADYRRYVFVRPVTVAVRGLHYGRYGADAIPSSRSAPPSARLCLAIRALAPSSIVYWEAGSLVPVQSYASPFVGPQAAGVDSGQFPANRIVTLVDAGVAWNRSEAPTLQFSRNSTERVPVITTGLSARMNLFGAMVLEIYYAYPFQRPDKGAHFGFQL